MPAAAFCREGDVTPELAPSTTLRRAAQRERERLERARTRINAKRETLQEELARLDSELNALGDRERLLGELVDEPAGAESAAGDEVSAGPRREVLKGAAIRERAARRYFLTHGADKALHYRHWFELLIGEGVEIAGKDPMATFLTNLNRSPVVVRGSEPATYAIDVEAPERLRAELAEQQAELRDLTEVIARAVTPTEELSDHRAQLTSDIRRLEGLIVEAERVLHTSEDEEDSADDHSAVAHAA